MISPGWQRAIGAAVVVPTAALSIPLTAAFLDQKVDENLLLPIAGGVAAGVGAATGAAMPKMFGSTMSRLGAAGIGAAIGVGVAGASFGALLFLLGDR